MDPHARAFAFLGRKAISDDLIVSDSEPEPSLRSTTTKATASTSQSQPRGRPTHHFSATRSKLEISGDSSRRLPSPVIIELSVTDDSDSGEEIQIIEKSHVLPTTRPQPPPLRAAATTSRFSLGNLASDVVGSDSETLSIDFSQFAYSAQPPQPKSRATSQSSVRSTHSIHSIRSVLPEKPSNVRMIHSATDFLTDRQIDLLSCCVACHKPWTTRKTVSKKREHLRICQKKHALMDDTIVLRIESEVAGAAEKMAQKKGKGKLKEGSVSPKKHATLMDAVVTDTLPKKSGKKKAKPATIIGIQHQHETMQGDARRLLGLDSDRPMPGLSAMTSTTVPLTQEFPVSKLGSRRGFEVDLAISLPSPVASDDDERKPISISSDSESRASGKYSRPSSHGSGKHRDLQNALQQSLTFQNGEDEWMQDLHREIDNRESMAYWDDAGMQDILHPETHITDLMERRVVEDNVMDVDSIPTEKKHNRKPKAPLAKDTTSETPVKCRTAIRPPFSTTSSPSKSKASPHWGGTASPSKTQPPGAWEALDQDDFNHLMQVAIRNDKVLWQRILRYEPVNLTEFLDIALAGRKPSKKLTDKLRMFLVSKAIQVIMPDARKRR